MEDGRPKMTAPVLDALPPGWRWIRCGCTTAPRGYAWACNGRSRFSPEYRHALVRLDDES